MYIIVLGIVILRLQISVPFHIKNHMDFQKVGEAIFNNEKYNILKPTTHVITDYFKDFMLRRENTNFPTKRVFIDHNGFRHAWTGFGEKIKSLRKTDHVGKSIDENNSLTEAKTESNLKESVKIKKKVSGYKTPENSTENNSSSEKYTEDIDTSNETIASKNISATDGEDSNTEILLKIKLRDGKQDGKSTSAPATKAGSTTKQTGATKKPDATQKKNNANKQEKPGRTIAQTTFFCPFFGVITMSAFID